MHIAESVTRVIGFATGFLAGGLTGGLKVAGFFSFPDGLTPARFFGVSERGFAARLVAGSLARDFEAARLFGFTAARRFSLTNGGFAAGFLAGDFPRGIEADCRFAIHAANSFGAVRLLGLAGSLARGILDLADSRLTSGVGDCRIAAQFHGRT